jgi:hypothetical protein
VCAIDVLARYIALPVVMIIILGPMTLPPSTMPCCVSLGVRANAVCLLASPLKLSQADIFPQSALVVMGMLIDSGWNVSLGTPWCDILDPFRTGGCEGSTVRATGHGMQVTGRWHAPWEVLETDPTIVEVARLVEVAVAAIELPSVRIEDIRGSAARMHIVVVVVEVVHVSGPEARRIGEWWALCPSEVNAIVELIAEVLVLSVVEARGWDLVLGVSLGLLGAGSTRGLSTSA